MNNDYKYITWWIVDVDEEGDIKKRISCGSRLRMKELLDKLKITHPDYRVYRMESRILGDL
jgi:hypothetical protein